MIDEKWPVYQIDFAEMHIQFKIFVCFSTKAHIKIDLAIIYWDIHTVDHVNRFINLFKWHFLASHIFISIVFFVPPTSIFVTLPKWKAFRNKIISFCFVLIGIYLLSDNRAALLYHIYAHVYPLNARITTIFKSFHLRFSLNFIDIYIFKIINFLYYINVK